MFSFPGLDVHTAIHDQSNHLRAATMRCRSVEEIISFNAHTLHKTQGHVLAVITQSLLDRPLMNNFLCPASCFITDGAWNLHSSQVDLDRMFAA